MHCKEKERRKFDAPYSTAGQIITLLIFIFLFSPSGNQQLNI